MSITWRRVACFANTTRCCWGRLQARLRVGWRIVRWRIGGWRIGGNIGWIIVGGRIDGWRDIVGYWRDIGMLHWRRDLFQGRMKYQSYIRGAILPLDN